MDSIHFRLNPELRTYIALRAAPGGRGSRSAVVRTALARYFAYVSLTRALDVELYRDLLDSSFIEVVRAEGPAEVRDALLRLPHMISGISPQVRDRLEYMPVHQRVRLFDQFDLLVVNRVPPMAEELKRWLPE